MAISYLLSTLGKGALSAGLPLMQYVDAEEMALVERQIERGLNSPLTSSCGRLFDAVSALLGVKGRVDYEAQAAIELEAAAASAGEGAGDAYPFSIVERDGMNIVVLEELFSALVADLRGGAPTGLISARFHGTVSGIIARMCRRLSERSGIRTVALSGGVFQNRLLFRVAVSALEDIGLTVLTHREVPANDGGVSLGQAVIANFSR